MYHVSRSSRAPHGAFIIVVAIVVFAGLLSAPAGAYTIKGDWDGPGQNPVTIKYYFANTTSDMWWWQQQLEIWRAMFIWQKYADITFVPAGAAGQSQSIDFGFYTGNHGDGSNFDGEGGILSHAFYPPPFTAEPRAGDVHFDDAEDWASPDRSLYSAALHEIGHALGLDHSTDTKSVMYSTFSGGSFGIGLCPDDIAAIRAIYAAKYPALIANISGTHQWRSDLEIRIGVKTDHSSPTPLLERVVFNQAGAGLTDFNFAEIDLVEFKPYMNGTNDFYVKIIDHDPQSTGTLTNFSMRIDGVTYTSPSNGSPLVNAPNYVTDGVFVAWIDDIPVAITPEPATLGMLGLGSLWLAWGHARRNSRKLRVR